MYKSILVPTDGSELSAKAVAQAVNIAKMSGARLTALHVIPPLSELAVSEIAEEYDESVRNGYVLPMSLQAKIHETISARSRALLDTICHEASAVGVECDSILAIGSSPHEEIIKRATALHYDLIVMASHGRKGMQAIVLGSETNKVLVHSMVPVLVVR
jgi:nucleotide-binding universal stress UspA family protein